jgi:hypothetical protein
MYIPNVLFRSPEAHGRPGLHVGLANFDGRKLRRRGGVRMSDEVYEKSMHILSSIEEIT